MSSSAFFPLPSPLSSYSLPRPSPKIYYRSFSSELDLAHIESLVSPSLSEPYSRSTYRYFVLRTPKACVLGFTYDPSKDPTGGAAPDEAGCMTCVCVCVCKVDPEDEAFGSTLPPPSPAPAPAPAQPAVPSVSKLSLRPPPPPAAEPAQGYVGMLSVSPSHQGLSVASTALRLALRSLRRDYGCRSAVLEVEAVNGAAVRVYEREGFVREGRLRRYYLNGSDAFRLRLVFDEERAGEVERKIEAGTLGC
jgi:ribosomal protein S18 acetylase RimI-like enzyme